MLELHVGIFALVQVGDDLVPQHAGFHHVAFFRGGHLVAALARQLEADPRDALDFVGVVDLGVGGAFLAVAEVDDGLGLAEIQPAGELAQDDDIEAVHHLALEARGIRERRIADRRPDVGEQAELLAQPQQPSLGPHVVGYAVPFRAADRAEQDRVGRLRLRHRVLGDGDAVHVVAAAADQRRLGLEPAEPILVHERDQPFDLGHHLGADAVAGKQQELLGHGNGYLVAGPRGLLKRGARIGKGMGDERRTDGQSKTKHKTDICRVYLPCPESHCVTRPLSSGVRFAVTSISIFISGRSRPATTTRVAAGRISANISPQIFSTRSASAGSTM